MRSDDLDLLGEAVFVLRDRLAGQLSGEARYLALLTANAVAMARRAAVVDIESIRAEADASESPTDVVGRIRNGEHDNDTVLHERLLMWAALRAWVADPEVLSADERRQFLVTVDTDSHGQRH